MIIHIHIYSLGFISFLFIFLHIIFFFFSLFFFFCFFFFFSSRRRHTRWPRDWSSDVCLPISRWCTPRGDRSRPPSSIGCAATPLRGWRAAPLWCRCSTGTGGTWWVRWRCGRPVPPGSPGAVQIGRASCRERVGAAVGGAAGRQ